MSEAVYRHVNALSMKYELLREMKHWKSSCKECIQEVTNNIRSLRESRGTVKREIHTARARLEERLRELEQISERQTLELAAAEEEIMKKFIKKLVDRHKKLEVTESLLKEDLIGTPLKRALEDGKHHALALQEAILETKKYDLANGVDFKMKELLYAITEQLDSLGTVTLVNSVNKYSAHKKTDELKALVPSYEGKAVSLDLPPVPHRKVETVRADSIEQTMLKDLDFILKMGNKYEHSLKPFLDSVKGVTLPPSTDRMKHVSDNSTSKLVNNTTTLECVQTPLKSFERPFSAKPAADQGPKIRTRLSKSAREDGRMPEGCLNDIDVAYVPTEEQGPETEIKVKKKKNQLVRYHDYDFVKEISVLQEGADQDDDAGLFFFAKSDTSSEGIPSEISRQPSPGTQSNASLSSVSYKPSNSLASGPVFITQSEQRKSKSHFKYMAKFHTKKHPYETDLCRLTGIVALDSGQIVVSDINHLQIMLFGPDYTYLDALECPSPCGLGHVTDNVVAVTLFHNRKVLLVKVHTIHLERYREFHIPCQEPLISVRYQDGRYYVLCFAGDVHVIDDDGKQTAIIETNINAGEARHMDINEDATRLFISGHDRVSCFTETGERLWYFTCNSHHRRFTPGDVVFYHDRLFVADWNGHKVLELSVDGTHVRDVIVDHVDFPHAITTQRNRSRIFITQSNFFKQEARSRSIKVFEIK